MPAVVWIAFVGVCRVLQVLDMRWFACVGAVLALVGSCSFWRFHARVSRAPLLAHVVLHAFRTTCESKGHAAPNVAQKKPQAQPRRHDKSLKMKAGRGQHGVKMAPKLLPGGPWGAFSWRFRPGRTLLTSFHTLVPPQAVVGGFNRFAHSAGPNLCWLSERVLRARAARRRELE